MVVKYVEREKVYRERVPVCRTCDWCGAGMLIEIGAFRVREFMLEFAEGYASPEGGVKEGWDVPDLCDDCIPRLRALLEEQGVTVRDVTVDW